MATWIVGAVVALAIGLAGYKVLSDWQKGKSCGSGCGDCQGCAVHQGKDPSSRTGTPRV